MSKYFFSICSMTDEVIEDDQIWTDPDYDEYCKCHNSVVYNDYIDVIE